MPLGRGVGRPGLIGTAARTAVIAGTAQATAGAISHRQQNRYAQQQVDAQVQAQAEQDRFDAAVQQAAAQQVAAQQVAAQQVPVAAPAPAAPAPAGGGDDLLGQLQQLAQLQAAGVLTAEEFAAAKAKLLG